MKFHYEFQLNEMEWSDVRVCAVVTRKKSVVTYVINS